MTPRERAEHHRLFLRNDPSGYASAGYAELLAPDLTERLDEVACPALVLTGEKDPEYHVDAQILSAKIPRLRVHSHRRGRAATRYWTGPRPCSPSSTIFSENTIFLVAKSTEETHEPID